MDVLVAGDHESILAQYLILVEVAGLHISNTGLQAHQQIGLKGGAQHLDPFPGSILKPFRDTYRIFKDQGPESFPALSGQSWPVALSRLWARRQIEIVHRHYDVQVFVSNNPGEELPHQDQGGPNTPFSHSLLFSPACEGRESADPTRSGQPDMEPVGDF